MNECSRSKKGGYNDVIFISKNKLKGLIASERVYRKKSLVIFITLMSSL